MSLFVISATTEHPKYQIKKSRIRETLNLLTDADHRTDLGGIEMVKKKKFKKKLKIQKM